MEQFSSTAYIESDLIGPEKTSLTYPIRCLLNEKIDLSKYGTGVRHIYFAPIISDKLDGIVEPYVRYLPEKKEIEVRFKMDAKASKEATLERFYELFIEQMANTLLGVKKLPDFDLNSLIRDCKQLGFYYLKVDHN